MQQLSRRYSIVKRITKILENVGPTKDATANHSTLSVIDYKIYFEDQVICDIV